jgi:hypothetical protein
MCIRVSPLGSTLDGEVSTVDEDKAVDGSGYRRQTVVHSGERWRVRLWPAVVGEWRSGGLGVTGSGGVEKMMGLGSRGGRRVEKMMCACGTRSLGLHLAPLGLGSRLLHVLGFLDSECWCAPWDIHVLRL